ncbi:RMD1 family protein [Aestuariibacter halophilus]|uniref:RMD1 family protein n=1 Tax=Fluctibacter halophilus TaxID=226011 RepID=A0ABS8GAH3_9ALTE|nr:RMD1 family protein [Aestuariibacter halophilus]MCC2617582.1 RMD1 family protein [Aestuariibacter halophilus]
MEHKNLPVEPVHVNAKRIVTYVVADNFDLSGLAMDLVEHHETRQYRDALHVRLAGADGFVFEYGVVISWGMSADQTRDLMAKLVPHAQGMRAGIDEERYACNLKSGQPVAMVNDEISLPGEDTLTMLAASHALAQSAKLGDFESKAEQTIADNQYLTQVLAETGKIPLSRKALAKLRGSLFQTKSDILLHFSLLDTPEFFWDHPSHEPLYQVIAKYLEITPRIELLRIKLETIQELFEVLAAEQNHKHSAFLEWIIIVLIAVDIIIYFIPK